MINLDSIKAKTEFIVEDHTIYLGIKTVLSDKECSFIEDYTKNNHLSLVMRKANLSDDEEKTLSEMDKFLKEMNTIPESEKKELSQELKDRMQNEVEAGYVGVSEEQRQKWRKKWLNDVD